MADSYLADYVPPLRGFFPRENSPTAPALGYVFSSLTGLARGWIFLFRVFPQSA
jgi:hypothetical protein